MVLANGLGGMTFAGCEQFYFAVLTHFLHLAPFYAADVGGFFGNPDPDMLVRWYQVGIMGPFFRAHAHIDTKRREPYLLEEPYKGMVKDILRLRYAMLPIWYTAFRETSVTGLPILRYCCQQFYQTAFHLDFIFRPQFLVFPKDKAGFGLDDQYYIGSSGLLTKPVTVKDATEATVYLAEDQVYYDYFSHNAYRGASKGKNVTIPAALHQLPLLVRGGSILPTRERPRRSSSLMKNDPFTLRVALSKSGNARGELYMDDGVSYDHQKGEFVWREFIASSKGKVVRVSSTNLGSARPSEAVDGVDLTSYDPSNDYAKAVADVRVEKMVILGLSYKPTSVKVDGSDMILKWEWTPGVSASGKKEGSASVLVVKDPKLLITKEWTIVIR